jgi:tetratricopeptide (TPR) repeat protein
LSFQQIEKNNQDASKLLRLLSFLNPDGILTDFLKAGKGGLDAERREIVSDDSRFGEALGELERFSLIGRQADSAGGERITIHRLVQTVIKDEMPPELSLTLTETVIRLCDAAFPASDYYADNETRSVKRRFQHQIVISLSSVHDINSRELGLILLQVGAFLRDDGKHREAVELLEKAFNILDTVQANNDSDTLTAMHHLGWAYDVLGRWTDAMTIREKLVQIHRGLHEGEHYETLTAMAGLAFTYRNLGRLGDAVKLQEEVLKARTKLIGEDRPETLMARANLALTYGDQGRLGDAINLQEEVLKANIRLLGEDHPETLQVMSNLGASYINGLRFDDSISLLEKSYEGRRKILGEQHPDTLVTLAWMAQAYIKDGRLDESIALYEKVLEGRKWGLGEDHPDTIKAKKWLERLRDHSRRYILAVPRSRQ